MNKLSQSLQTIKAARYIGQNLKVQIIARYTELPEKYLRALVKELTGRAPSSGRLITTQRLFRNKRTITACILFVSIYLRLDEQKNNDVDLEILINAYKQFTKQAVLFEVLNHPQCSFTINDAWVLINAYLDKVIQLSPCPCGNVKLISRDIQIDERCWFCGSVARY
ncbi:hypothetical protein JQC92_20855 [Shewanella sp. 202IG2-18]|uniref:FlhC family transcriptional regulator n=1 Tax=Parashewanella hymeniacidonis TaxID=2807618 RepID=UPI00195F3AFB|nr:FlhC family transcriptional regulator [Parashewanella hymeniacidonis]MBM7074441.1 hypothetical protein [Parashewanella hymeniacidonis]